MKLFNLLSSLLLGSGLLLGILLLSQPAALAAVPNDTIVVTTTIQDAIDQANPGDTVQIPSGNYRESIVLEKAVNLIGEGSKTTIIEARSGRRVIHVRGTAVDENVTISGLTVTNGNVGELLFLCPVSCGGGIMLEEGASPRMDDIRFLNNRADGRGGGLYADRFSTVHISNSEWVDNEAGDYGGGLFSANAAVVDNGRFTNNTSAISGGGLTVVQTLTMTNTDFISNTATFLGGAGLIDGAATVQGGTFSNNQSMQRSGGALYVVSSLTLNDATFTNNSAGSSGGGVRAASHVIGTNNIFTHNFAHNDGGGLKVDGLATLSDVRFENNIAEDGTGGGMASDSETTITNAIFVANQSANGGAYYHSGSSTSTITHSCFVDNSDTSVVNNGSALLTTTDVWWGAENGPSGQGPGDGDSVGSNVAFDAFATMPILDCDYRSGATLYLPIIRRGP
ncbi:MAG: hypothetical protein AAF614_15950 [Chloroflexota bacterium]